MQTYYHLHFPGACSLWSSSVGLGKQINRLSMCTFGSFFKRVRFHMFQVGQHKLWEETKYISKVHICLIGVRNYQSPVTGVLCQEKCIRKKVTTKNKHKWRQVFRTHTGPLLSAVSGNSRFKSQSPGETRTPLCLTPLNHCRKQLPESCWSRLSSGAENRTRC